MNIKLILKLELVEATDNKFKAKKTEAIMENICGNGGHVDLQVEEFKMFYYFYQNIKIE